MDKKYIEYPPKKFDKKSYDKQYRQEHYRQFAANVKPELKERLDNFCKEQEISKAEFLSKAIELMEKEYGRK